jgi:hypothetical protein
MGDAADAITDAVDKAGEEGSRLSTAVAVAVAILATFLAVCNVKDGNVAQAMAKVQAQSVDQWSYYQAKGTKQNLAEVAASELEVARDTQTALTPEQRKTYDDKIAYFHAEASRYDKEKKDIKAKAEGFDEEYEKLNNKDDQFDMCEALVSVAIALFGITALTKKRALFAVACVFGGIGLILGIAGFAGLGFHPDWLARALG